MRWTVHSEKPLYQDEWLDIRLADVELLTGGAWSTGSFAPRPARAGGGVRDASLDLG